MVCALMTYFSGRGLYKQLGCFMFDIFFKLEENKHIFTSKEKFPTIKYSKHHAFSNFRFFNISTVKRKSFFGLMRVVHIQTYEERVLSFLSFFLTLRPDFTSKLVHVLAFGTPKFYIAPYDEIKHELVNLSSNCDMKWGLRLDFTSKLVHVLAFGTPKFYIAPYDKIKRELVNLSSNCDVKSGLGPDFTSNLVNGLAFGTTQPFTLRLTIKLTTDLLT